MGDGRQIDLAMKRRSARLFIAIACSFTCVMLTFDHFVFGGLFFGAVMLMLPSLSASAFLIVFTKFPVIPVSGGSIRKARQNLRADLITDYLTPWKHLAVVLALSIFGGLTAGIDEMGQSRIMLSHNHQHWVSPYPGWYYGIPVSFTCFILASLSTHVRMAVVDGRLAQMEPWLSIDILDRKKYLLLIDRISNSSIAITVVFLALGIGISSIRIFTMETTTERHLVGELSIISAALVIGLVEVGIICSNLTRLTLKKSWSIVSRWFHIGD